MIADKSFYDAALDLTGEVVSSCYFDGCILTVNVSSPPSIFHSVVIVHCRLIGDGWPPEVFEDLDA